VPAHDPATLGEIDAVDVVDLDHDPAKVKTVADYIRVAVRAERRLTGADAQRIADLWRKLPPGEQARCHMPPYGLRFWRAGQLLVEASLCWECANVYGYAGDEGLWFGFDVKAPAAVALLAQLRHVWP
jgi:hypothetical protein